MKTLKLTSAWILICLITAVSSGPSERASSHHVAQHGARTPQKTSPDSTGPTGVQIPDHVLSTQDVSCISADNNIFQIMQEAQKTCNGTDMRCTFYHFVNHEYQNIGTLDVNKELFDDLLMKFDNWLLTAESIDKTRENGKTNEHSTNTTSNHEKDKYKNEGRNENLTDTTESNQGKLNDNISESDDDRQHSHHIKNPDEIHRKNHHHKLKNLNHVKAFTEYNKEHKYFEVFMPKDRETGKPRTIYVEVDEDKHEFILIDEDIDKKLKGIKPIRIELDELSDIADTAFSNLVKSASHKKHNHNNNTNENQITASDLHTDSGLDKIEIHLDVGKDESAHNIFNSSVCDSPICNISTNQEIILNSDMEHIENTLNDTNLVVPVEYINEEQIQTKSQIDNTTQDIITDHLDILQNINETDIQEPEYEKESFDTVEFDHNNITDFDIDSNYIEVNSSQDFIKIPCENEDDNCTEHHDFSIDHDIDTYDDNDFIQLDEHNDTSNEIDFDDTHETLSYEPINLNEPILQDDQPIQETKLETIPYKPKLPSALNDGVVDYTSSEFHLLPPENQNAPTELQDHSLESHAPMKPFTAIPILGKDSAKAVETESQSSFLEYAPAVLSESDSHNLVLNPDLNPSVLLRDYSSPVANKKVSGNPKTVSPDLSILTKDPNLLPIEPSYNVDIQNPYLSTAPIQLGANTPMSTKNSILPSKFALPKSIDFDKMPTMDQFNESPLSVIPYSVPQYTPDFIPTKDNLGLVRCLPVDNDIKETMTPCSANRNRYPCNTIPYSSNPCLKPPQYLPSYYEPPVPITPLQPTSKIPSVEFLPNSVDQSNVCFNADYPRETKPIPLLPFAPCTPFSPLNPLWLEPGSFPSTCPNLWNNIPYQTVLSAPYSVLPAQNICNYPSMLSNYLAPNIGPQQDQFLKLLPIKEVPKVPQQPCECPSKNVLQMTPSTNVLYSPMYTRPLQIDFNPTLNLGRDLQTLSFKYGIPLTKIHDALDAEISDNPKSWLPFELPRPKFVNISPLKNKPATNSVDYDQNRSGNNKDLIESDLINLTPLDSTLIGPRLDIDKSLRLSPNDFQTYTVASETTGSQLSTLETSNIQLSDEDRTGNIKLHLKSDSRNLVPLESSLIVPHLKNASPPVNVHFETVFPVKPLLNNDIRIINEMIPLQSDITELSPLDSSHVDLVNDVKPLEILQHAKTTTVETEGNFIEGELVSESDSHKVIPLDPSLLGPNLKTQNSAIITNASEGKSGSLKPYENIESTDIKFDEMESIILPSSMLTTLLSKPVNADLSLATDSPNSKLNNLLETNLELPITESSLIKTKETDFQIIEPSLEMIDATILEGKSKPTDITVEVNSKTQLDSSLTGPSLLQGPESREMTQILDSVDHLETYEAVPISNLNKKLLNIIAITDSEIQYDSSLTGPNLQQGMKTTGKDMESIIELDDSFVTPDFLETIESSATSSLSEEHQLHGSIKGTLKPESEYRAFDSKNVLDSSLVGPHLQTTPFSNDEIKMIHKELQQKSELANLIPLDSSLVGPHLHFDSRPDLSDISRYHNPESSSFFKGGSSLKPIDMPSDLQELLSKFTKSQLSPCEMKPCEKSLSSMANICAGNNFIDLPCKNFQEELTSEYYPIKTIPEHGISPIEHGTKEKPCYNSNYHQIPMMYPEYAYIKGIPQPPIIPLVDSNWLEQPFHIQNVHPTSPCLRPAVENVQLTREDLNLLLDLASQYKLYPHSSNPEIYTPGKTIASSEWITPSNILPLSNYSPLVPKKSFTVLPSILESTVSNQEYKPIIVDDITSLIDEDTHQLLKDMSILPSVTPTIPTVEGEIVSPSLLDTSPITYTDFKPCNSQPCSRIPLDVQFVETIGPPSKLIPLTTESPNAPISEWHQIPNKPQYIESIENPILGKEYLQQLLTPPYLDSPMILPSSALESMLKMPTASNTLNGIPCQMPTVNFSPIQTPLSIATSPIVPNYAKPLSVSYAKPISFPCTSLPLPASPAPSLFNSYTTIPFTPESLIPLMPINTAPSDCRYLAAYKSTSSVIPYKPTHSYSSPCIPFHTSPLPFDNSPYLQAYNGKITPVMTNPYSPVYIKPMSSSYLSPIPKSLTKLKLPPALLTPIESTQIDFLSHPYVSPITYQPSPTYLPLPVSANTLTRPPSVLSQTYITPILPINTNPTANPICLPSDLKYFQQKPINAIPISVDINPFSNTNQMLPICPYTDIPISSYSTHVPKPIPCSEIKEYIPCGNIIQPNSQTSFLTSEEPLYEVKDESVCSYSNDKANYYHEPSLKYPIESTSYTLVPEHVTETFSDEVFVNEEDFIPLDHFTSIANEPNVNQRPVQTKYTPLYDKPEIAIQYLPPPPLTELIQPNIFDNILPMPAINPYQASLPTPIQFNQVLKPITPVTSAPNLSILPSSYMSVIPYNIIPIKQEPLVSLPKYYEISQTLPISPIAPLKIVSSMNSPKSQPTLSVLDNFIPLPPTQYVPKPKTLISPRLYASPIISHVTSIEAPSVPQYITPLTLPKKEICLKPLLASQYVPSVLPTPIKFQNNIPLSEVPIHYEPYNPPIVLPSPVKSIPVASQYTVLPLPNNIAKPLRANKPQWSSISPQYTLPALISSPIPVPCSTVPFPTILPVTTPPTTKQVFTNHIIPSSLFLKSPDFEIPCNKLASNKKLPKYSPLSPVLTVPLETVPYETLSMPLEKTVVPQNILKPNRQFSSGPLKVVPSSPYLTRPLEPTYYPVQTISAKTLPKLSPISSYSPLTLQTIPYQQINEAVTPQYSLPIPVYASNKLLSAKNPFSDPNFKPMLEVPWYPVPNLISSNKITPLNSILLSNLQPLDISQESLNSYLSPLTASPKLLAQKSSQFQEIPNYSQYVTELTENVPELLPSTNPLPKSPILKPLLSSSQNNIPLFPMYFSSLDSTIPDNSPSTKQEYSSSFAPVVSEISETVAPINVMPTTSTNLSKPQLNKHYQLPVSIENMPLFSNYNIVESSSEIPVKSNIGNTVQPVDITMISASELSPQYSLDSEIIEELKPYEHIKEKFLPTGTVSSLPTNLSQQIKFHPVLSKYLTIPQSLHNTLPLSKHKHSKTTVPLLGIPEEVEVIDTTDFIPLSELKSEPLVVDYIPIDKQATILKNIPEIEPDITQFSSYTTLSNTDFSPSKPNPLLTKLPTSRYGNQFTQNTPIYLSPQEYKDLIQGFLPKESSSSSANFFTSTNPKPDLTISPMTVGTRPVPLSTNPISFRPEDWVQPPILAKYLPAHEIPIEVAPEKENIQTFLNKYKLNNKISPTGINNYPYELVSEVPLKMDTVKPIPLRKSGPNTEYDVIELNNFSEYDNEMIPHELETKNNEVRDNKPKNNEAMSFTEVKPEIIEGLSMPKYHDITHRHQKPSKLDSFYANNHIGKSPQVFTVPEYNTLSVGPAADVKTLHNVSPDILNDFTEIPTDFEFVPKLESLSHKSSDFQPKISYTPTKIPENYLYPCLKPCSQREFPPNAIELANASEMPCQTNPYVPYDLTKDIKYSGYKTYQMPYLKPPKMTQNFVTPIQEYVPIVVPCTSPIHSIKPSNVQQITNPCEFYRPAEDFESHPPIDIKTSLQTKLGLDTIQEIPEFVQYDHLIPEHQTLVDKSTPVQTKLGLNTLNESLEFEEYNQEESPVHADNDIEDKELKTSLLNYINKREDVKNNIYNSIAELTIPIGNIAITKKEPHNANTIETNNPSIGLKVWKSNVKIAQAELKLKFKDLSVTNFMPVVNNLDEYDMDEIRKIIKNYIDDKYGPHIEVNEPYTVDNKYAVIKDFEHHAADNKYNLLWPTKYV